MSWRGRLCGGLLCAIGLAANAYADEALVRFDIPAAEAKTALNLFARQSGTPVLYMNEILGARRTNAVNGKHTVRQALEILLRNTGISGVINEAGVLTISVVVPENNAENGETTMQRNENHSNRGAAFLAAVAAFFAAGFTAHSARGDENSQASYEQAPKLEEIIVTARRREENLQQIPVAVTVLSQPTLEANNVTTLSDLQFLVPSLTTVPQGYKESVNINIRGQGGNYNGNAPGVILALNDVPFPPIGPGDWGGPGLFFDLENVQALKGPQGTLFGRNSVGGDLLLQTARPTNALEGRLQATYGNYNDHEFDGVLNIPLVSDVLLARVAFETQIRQGYSHILAEPGRPNGIYADNRNQRAFRATVAFHPTDGVQSDTVVGYAEYNQYGAAEAANTIPGSPAAGVYPTLPALQAQQQALGPRTFLPISTDNYSNGSLFTASNTTRIQINDQLTFKNIVGFVSLYQAIQIDQDGTPLPLFDFPVPQPQTTHVPTFVAPEQFTEEAQLLGKSFDGRLNWIVGGFFLDDPKWGHGGRNFTQIAFGVYDKNAIQSIGEWSRALFTQGTYELTPKLKVTAGIRYTWDDIKQTTLGNNNDSVCLGPAPIDCGLTAIKAAASQALTWTGALDYQVTPSTLLYLTSRRGYREGGFNGVQHGVTLPSYKPEYVTDGEFGVKSDWTVANVPIRTNADVWYQDYTEIQLAATVPSPVTRDNPGGYLNYTLNAGAGKFYGAEIESQAILTEHFQVGVNFNYLQRDYTSFNPDVKAATIADLRASATLGNPKYKYGLNASYDLPVPSTVGKANVKAYWNWQSYSGDTLVPLGWGGTPAFGLLNLAADWKGIYGSSFDLSFFASNVLNKTYILDPTPSWQPGFYGGVVIYGDPRLYGVRLQYRFGGAAK